MTIFGLGQYPNLGVTDAFIAVGTKDKHRVIRASRPLHDRSDLKVGPISIEILDPLKSLRIRCEANEWGIDLDVTWTASHYPLEEPRQYLRREGKVVFDTMRFAQLGRWEGHLHTPDQSWDIDPESWEVVEIALGV